MTNLKQIQSMSLEDFAKWLDEYGQFDNSPWMKFFNEKYCENCDSIKIDHEDAKTKLGLDLFSWELTAECAFCEINDHCKFFPDIDGIPSNLETIRMWLEEEAK